MMKPIMPLWKVWKAEGQKRVWIHYYRCNSFIVFRMNILDKIIESKKKSVKEQKDLFSIQELMSSQYFKKETNSLAKRLNSGETTGIIAEFKRRSPSKGIINNKANIVDVVSSFEKYGAAGISV